MNPDSHLDAVPRLPPELADLDAELALFTATERSSFAPELEAELGRVWRRGPRRLAGLARARRAVAAAVVGLLLTGMAVPPARASLITGFGKLIEAFQEPAIEPALAQAPTRPIVDSPRGAEPALPSPPEAPAAEAPVAISDRPDEEVDELPAFRPAQVTYPTLADPDAERDLIRRHYPPELQRAGVGGTVGLLLWVAEDGSVDNVQTRSNSGVAALDRAAMQGARSLRFRPASRDGVPVGTYVEFDLVFEPVEDEWVPPEIVPVGDPELPEGFAYELSDDGPLTVSIPAPIRLEARELLGVAIGEPEEVVESRLGPLDGLLAGDPPAGTNPLAWRRDATRELERAMARDPDNPAPVLALARIRRKQGLRLEARDLYERGVERGGRRSGAVSPRLVAELKFELADVVRESWMSWSSLGYVSAEALDGVACTRRRPGASDLETLIASNYVCPAELGAALAAGFQPSVGGEEDRLDMLALLDEAVEAFPGHVGANVAILLDRSDEQLWVDVLNGARRFAWTTNGHPYGFLLSGLALQRLGRSEEAMEDFEQAFTVLGEEVETSMRDIRAIMSDDGPPTEDFWRALDPILNTEVNEREVEHLARAAYAYLRFGDLDSDAARLWLRYGRPEVVRTFGTADLRTEFWDYGQGPDVTFNRPATSDDRTYTAEARSYLNDLRGVFPHWYGTRARSLFSLPAQATRFRGIEPGTGEVEVHLEIPQALKTFEGDSLDLGLFLLGADGSAVSVTKRRISGDSVRLRTGVGSDALIAVVELYNPRTHQAAALRMPALRGSDASVDQRISDLMLVGAAAPLDRDIGRTDAWVAPLVRRDQLAQGRVGLLFELYDLPEGSPAYYRIRLEAESETTGEVRVVSFRPGGQTLFGTEWTRSPAGREGRVVEYLTLDLEDFQAGDYALRAVVEFDEGPPIVEELRGISLRLEGTPAPPATELSPMRMQFE
jgi:protein TonB